MTDLTALRAAGPIKTWSLLVSVLGDRQAGPDSPVSGPELSALFAEMGVKPEALRVAIHRMSKEGWIESRKVGRTRAVFLSKTAWAETEAARPRVYEAAPPGLTGWHIHFTNGPVDAPGPHVRLAPTVLASPAPVPNAVSLPLSSSRRPDWLVPLSERYVQTLEKLAILGSTETLAARMLTLHHWRRIALQDGFWLLREWEPEGLARRGQDFVLEQLSRARTTPENAPL